MKVVSVECDASGHVVSLQLQFLSFKFKYLQKLNLAHNDFYRTRPATAKGIGNLTCLKHLNLSYAGFGGQFRFMWDTLLSLTSLIELDLSGNSLSVDVGKVNSSSYASLQLKRFYLASCNLSNFPDFIQDLDLSANSIPSWIWGTKHSST